MKLSLRVKVTGSIFGVIFLSLVSLSFGLSQVINQRFSELEQRETHTNARRVEEVLQNQFALPSSKIPDWANWDDTFKYASDGNKQYETTNLIPATLDNLSIDSMRIFKVNGDLVYALDKDLSSENIQSKALLDDALKTHPQLLKNTQTTAPTMGLFKTQDIVWSFAVMPIRKGSGEGEPSGLILFCRQINAAATEKASSLAKIKILSESIQNAKPTTLLAKKQGVFFKPTSEAISGLYFRVIDDNTLSIVAEAKDIDGNAVGFFSAELPRELMLEGRRTLSTLLYATSLVSILTLAALVYVMRRFVISRLRRVRKDINQIESSDSHARRVSAQGNDEIGVLANALNRMLVTIEERNAAMREIIENVKSGFMVLDTQGMIQEGYTAYCEELLNEKNLTGKPFSHILSNDEHDRAQFGLMYSQIIDDFLPEDVSLSQLPIQFEKNQKWIGLIGTVVRAGDGTVKDVLMTLSDITELKKSENEREQISAAIKVIRSRDVFNNLIKELPATLEKIRGTIRNEKDQTTCRKVLHTLKGNLSMFGLAGVAKTIHNIEDAEKILPAHIDQIETMIKDFLKSQHDLLKIEWGKEASEMRSLSTDELSRLLSEVISCSSLIEAKAKIAGFVSEAMKTRAEDLLQPLIESGKNLATRFGKQVNFEVYGANSRIDRLRFGGVFDSLINAVRNALDHGFETPDERGSKPVAGTLKIGVIENNKSLTIVVEDDGRGVQFDRLCEAVVKKGLTTAQAFNKLNDDEKIAFLFESDVSTADAVSDISGRGLGLAGLRDEVQKLGGKLSLKTWTGKGTRIVMELPLAAPRLEDKAA